MGSFKRICNKNIDIYLPGARSIDRLSSLAPCIVKTILFGVSVIQKANSLERTP